MDIEKVGLLSFDNMYFKYLYSIYKKIINKIQVNVGFFKPILR